MGKPAIWIDLMAEERRDLEGWREDVARPKDWRGRLEQPIASFPLAVARWSRIPF